MSIHSGKGCRRIQPRGNVPRQVVDDPSARYFGAELSERSLVPGDDAQLGEMRFKDWLTSQTPQTTAAAASKGN